MEQHANVPTLRDTAKTYGLISRLNHWIVAAAMIGMLFSGLTMAYGPFTRETVGAIRDWHKAVGVLILGYGMWRVGWRLAEGFPEAASIMPRWQSLTSKMTHWALLCTVIAMPLSGIVMSVYGGRNLYVFGMVIPAQDKVEWISNAAGSVHHFVAIALGILLILHVAAALKHHLINRDTTLNRMVGRIT